jgi:hypothetical protein
MASVRKYLKNGFRVTASDNEGPARLSFQLQTGGETSLRPVLDTLVQQLEFERAWRHDRNELQRLSDGCENWFRANQDALAKLKDSDRRDTIKAVNIEALLKDKHAVLEDGLRSAFDPAMADAFKAMLVSRNELLRGGEYASDVSQSGFEWFGLATDEVKIRSDTEYGWGSISDAWLVAASRDSWVRGGRACLVQSGMNYRVVWLSEVDYNALKLANVSGGRLKAFKERTPQPLWKLKLRLWRQRYQVQEMQSVLQNALKQTDGTYREFSFKGSEHDDAVAALIEALKLGDDQRWTADQAANYEIEVKDKSCKVRLVMDGQWIEIDEKGKVTTSWGDD